MFLSTLTALSILYTVCGQNILFTETAQVLVLQFHFMDSANTLSSFTNQLQTLGSILPVNIQLPRGIAWRVAAPMFRTNASVTTKFPSLEENVQSIRSLVHLYSSRNQTLHLVYYPDVGIGYTTEWATTDTQRRAVKIDPTIAVHTLMPSDLRVWNSALRAAAKKDGGEIVLFDELVFESYGAPIQKPAAMSPTIIALRANPLLKDVAVSLTPDFSVMGGKCKRNVHDSCNSVVRNPLYPKGTYYTQAYNIYTTQTTQTKTLTDVTPWDLSSPSDICVKLKSRDACTMKSTCCSWLVLSKDINVCSPKVTDAQCTYPDNTICGTSGTRCDPSMGHSIYADTVMPFTAAQHVGQIIGDRLLERCNPGGASIEALTAKTVWETFTIVFSYEYWSAPGPPLWLMGNPQRPYNITMWSEFVTEFRKSLALRLQQQPPVSASVTPGPTPVPIITTSNVKPSTGLCSRAAKTLTKDVRFGVYWARRALVAWGVPSKDPIVDCQYTSTTCGIA
jgi:hypothetical protein